MLHVHRPSRGTATGRVWELADELTKRTGKTAKRADVIRSYVAEGGNPNTASTQYHHWKAFQARGARPGAAKTFDVQVAEGGRVVLPVELRRTLGIEEGEVLSAQVVDGEIRLVPADTAIRRAQELVRKFVPHGVSLVEDLIAERRREARRENEE